MPITPPTAAGDSTVATSLTTTLVLNRPANTVNGETLGFFVAFRTAAGTVTGPSGAAQVGPVSNANQSAQLFYKTAAAGETTYTFTTSAGSGRNVGICFRVPGVDTAITPVVGALSTPAAESSLTIPSLATTAANSGVFAFGVAQNASTTGVTFTPDPAWDLVNQGTINNGSSSSAAMVAFKTQAAVGSVGSMVSTMASGSTPAASNDQGWMVAFAPQVAAPPASSTSTAYIWTGSAWVKHDPYRHNGTSWVRIG
jgi:hypothetical protein